MHKMRRFYSEQSTLIHVINGNVDARITSNLDKIVQQLSKLNVVNGSVEKKSINSLNCWGLGILLIIIKGSLKLKKDVKCSNFVQTMYLVPRGKKDEKKTYCIMHDILHIIKHNYQVTHHSKPVVSLKSQDIDPRFFSESKHPPGNN
jgi:hypothetical protein